MKQIAILSAATIALSLGTFTMSAEANQADRRAAMKTIGKTFGGLRKGTADPAEAGQTIATLSAQIPALFEVNEISGDSEATPDIWDNYADFTAKGADLEAAAKALVDTAAAGGDVAGAVKTLGGTCSACHKPYKL